MKRFSRNCVLVCVVYVLSWSLQAYGTTEYNDNIQPLLHVSMRNELINENQDLHQPKLIVNKARFYTENGPAAQQQPFSSSSAALPPGISEDVLFRNIDFSSFMQGYGDDKGGKIERIDEAVKILPTIEETRQGQDQTFDHQLPDLNKFNRVDNTKEIHTYTAQKKIVTVNNRNLHRYLKNLNVNTQYNTNIEKIAHSKLNNLLINNLQETHQPKLLVKYSRTDTTQDLGVRNEAPIVENERRDNRLPDVFIPAVAERIGYNGQPLPVKTEVVADETETLPLLSGNGETMEMPRGKLFYSDAPAEGGNGSLTEKSGQEEAPANSKVVGEHTRTQNKTSHMKKSDKEKLKGSRESKGSQRQRRAQVAREQNKSRKSYLNKNLK